MTFEIIDWIGYGLSITAVVFILEESIKENKPISCIISLIGLMVLIIMPFML